MLPDQLVNLHLHITGRVHTVSCFRELLHRNHFIVSLAQPNYCNAASDEESNSNLDLLSEELNFCVASRYSVTVRLQFTLCKCDLFLGLSCGFVDRAGYCVTRPLVVGLFLDLTECFLDWLYAGTLD